MDLGAKDRIEVALSLLESCCVKSDVDAVVKAACQACGVFEEDNSSRNGIVDARRIIAYSLSRAGLHDGRIAGVIGRTRTTAIYMRNTMQDALALPASNPDLVSRFTRFNELLYATH